MVSRGQIFKNFQNSNHEVMKISKIGRILKLKKSELKKSNFKENIPDEKSKLYIKYIISRFLKLPNKLYFKPSFFFSQFNAIRTADKHPHKSEFSKIHTESHGWALIAVPYLVLI